MLKKLPVDDARPRFGLVAVPLVFAMLAALLLPATATASPDAGTAADKKPGSGLLQAAPVPVTGMTADGIPLNAEFTLKKFTEKHGVLYAVGKLDGTLGDKVVHKQVKLPVTGASTPAPVPAGGVGQSAIPQQATPGAV